MTEPTAQASVLKFGTFELDAAAGELRKNGRRVPLPGQPLQLLTALADRPGEVVTRGELKEKLWPSDTYVDFDRSLNTAASKVREALGDSASSPRFIETLPRRGYRFLAPVEVVGESGAGLNEPTASAADSAVREAHLQRHLRLAWTVAATAIMGFLAVLIVLFSQTPEGSPPAPVRKFTIVPPARLGVWQRLPAAISPDGRRLVVNIWDNDSAGRLWLQDLTDGGPPERVAIGDLAVQAFWSPDGRYIGYTDGERILKISIDGGPAVPLCDLQSRMHPVTWRASWSADGKWIVFGSAVTDGLWQVPASGGTPTLLVSPESLEAFSIEVTGPIITPHFLPSEAGKRALLYAVSTPEGFMLSAHDIESGRAEVLGPGQDPFYSPSGHILYQRDEEIWALPFSLDTLRSTGAAFPVVQDAMGPSVSRDGVLVYTSGRQKAPTRRLGWLDRDGQPAGTIGDSQESMRYPLISPDRRRVAVTAGRSPWVWDIARGVAQPVSPESSGGARPTWSPNGEELAFTVTREVGNSDIHLARSDGSGGEAAIAATADSEYVNDWSRDGKYLLFERQHENVDLWYLTRGEDGSWEPHPFLTGPENERAGAFSPDGRFVAYLSDESALGQYEVYVQAFPDGGTKTIVSGNNGRQPRWSRDGKELFFVEGYTLRTAPAFASNSSFSVGPAVTLFESPFFAGGWIAQYDVAEDGERFLVTQPLEEPEPRKIRVVQNWYEDFRDRE